METSGATRFKLPIMAAATHNIVVSTNAFRGSPFLDVFAKVSRNGTIPSPAIAYDNCPQMHISTYFLEWWCMSWYEVTSKPMVLIQWCLYAIEIRDLLLIMRNDTHQWQYLKQTRWDDKTLHCLCNWGNNDPKFSEDGERECNVFDNHKQPICSSTISKKVVSGANCCPKSHVRQVH